MTETRDLLDMLTTQRTALSAAVHGLTERQARSRPSASGLSLSGLLKHAARCERGWIQNGIANNRVPTPTPETWHREFEPDGNETVPVLLAAYELVAEETERTLAGVTELDVPAHLPPAAWPVPGRPMTRRHVLLHLIEETARHAGHADIIRESLDGALSHELLGQFTAAA